MQFLHWPVESTPLIEKHFYTTDSDDQIKDGEKSICRVVLALFQNISNLEEAESKLLELCNFLDQAVELSPVGLSTEDIQHSGKPIYCTNKIP